MHQTNHVALCGQIVNIFVGNKGSVIVTLRVNGQHPKIIFFNELAKEVLEMYSVGMLLSVTGFCVSSYHYGKYTQAIFAKTLHPMPADTYERKNEFSYEGEVVYIRNYDRHTHLVIKVVDDGHTAHIPVNYFANVARGISCGDKVTAIGMVGTVSKGSAENRRYYQNFLGEHIFLIDRKQVAD